MSTPSGKGVAITASGATGVPEPTWRSNRLSGHQLGRRGETSGCAGCYHLGKAGSQRCNSPRVTKWIAEPPRGRFTWQNRAMSDPIRIDLKPEFIPSTNPFTRLGQHPIGFWFVFSGELAEHASYYGMRTLLALYMIDVLGFSQAAGATVMKAFMAACYLTPFFGGWVAEKYLGRYKTILYYSLPYILGHVILGG